jgi:hypothetical protein
MRLLCSSVIIEIAQQIFPRAEAAANHCRIGKALSGN